MTTRRCRLVPLALGLACLLAAIAACPNSPPPTPPNRTDEDGGDTAPCIPPCVEEGTPPAPWATLTWTLTEVDGGDPSRKAGNQGRLLRAADGTLFYAHLKVIDPDATCNIAVFGGGPAPMPQYAMRVLVRAPGATTWTAEEVSFAGLTAPGYPTSLYGLDGVLNNSNQPVFALAAGGPGLAQCGSTDLVLVTRQGASSYNVQAVSTASGDCCPEQNPLGDPDQQDCCNAMQNACRTGSDVGTWAAIAKSSSGQLAVAQSDYHNYWDQDGQNHQGFELWSQSGGVTGIRAWSGLGLYAALAFAGDTPVAATTGYKTNGLFVFRRTSNANACNDWHPPTDDTLELGFGGWEIGERIRMAVAPDGTLGLVFHAKKDRLQAVVNDLVYCSSTDEGATWSFPCKRIGTTEHVGNNPSLAYDADSIPYVSYYYCGTDPDCPASQDGLRFAWWDQSATPPRWWRFVVHAEASSQSGLYSQIVVDPTTKEPTIIFQHATRGSVVVAQGNLNP